MNPSILQKCLDELSKSEGAPNIDYVRGMLETLIAMAPKETSPQELKKVLGIPDLGLQGNLSNQGTVLGGSRVPNLDEIKRMAGEV